MTKQTCFCIDREKEIKELIQLVVDDLRMRADEDGVVNISDFIWKRLIAELEKGDE